MYCQHLKMKPITILELQISGPRVPLSHICYVDINWDLQTHHLQAYYMPEDHTGMQLQDALSVTLEQRNLEHCKLTALTADSASNIKLACQQLKWKRLSCFDHNLDLAISKGLHDG